MATETPASPSESARSRLQEFPSDYLEAANEAAKFVRMDEMEAWANGIGAHTERLVHAHQVVGRQIINHAHMTGKNPPPAEVQRDLVGASRWRTGVHVKDNGDIEVHDQYPYSGDTPAGGWTTYRSPKNIRKN